MKPPWFARRQAQKSRPSTARRCRGPPPPPGRRAHGEPPAPLTFTVTNVADNGSNTSPVAGSLRRDPLGQRPVAALLMKVLRSGRAASR